MTAPMQRAINAAIEAIPDDVPFPAEVARLAIVAAYPHLYQALAKENRELRNKLKEQHDGQN